MQLALGLLTGILFGYLAQRARVLRYDKQLGALRLKDMTIVKFMLSSIIVYMVGVHVLNALGLAELPVKATVLGANVIGGLVFGIGWGLLGYCPATAAGALGEGRLDAAWGLAGMIAGAAVFARAYPWLKETVYTWGDLGKITLPGVLGLSPWVVMPVLVAVYVGVMVWFERKKL